MLRRSPDALTGVLFGVLIGAVMLVTKLLAGTAAAEAAKQALLTGAVTAVVLALYIRSFSEKQAAEFIPVREELSRECSVLRDAAANHRFSGESVGGRLFLTDDRLYFRSQTMNVLSHSCTVYLDEIDELRLLKLFGMFSNGFEVVKKDGTKHSFAVSDPKKWIAETNTRLGS